MFLIVSASSTLGRETARQLLDAGYAVRALVRDPRKVADLQQQGAEVVQGDLVDPASLARACQGVAGVLAAAHSMLGRGVYRSEQVDDVGHRALIDAAKAAKVNHFVYTSVIRAAPDHPIDFWRTKYKIEQYLKASGLSYTILRPTASMDQQAHEFLGKPILLSGKATVLGQGNNPTNFVAARDVARFAVMALTDEKTRGKTIEVGGLENLTKNQIAELYGRRSACTPKLRHVPPGIVRVVAGVLKRIHPGLSRIMLVNVMMDATDQRFDPSATLSEFPVPLTRFEDFVAERVTAAGRSRSKQNT